MLEFIQIEISDLKKGRKYKIIEETSRYLRIFIGKYDGSFNGKYKGTFGSYLREQYLLWHHLYYIIRHYTPFADNFFKLLRKKTESLGEKTSNIKGNALKYCEFNNKDSIICGHSHKPEHEYDKFEYINTGSFCEEKASYLIIDKKGKANLIYLD